MKTAPIRKKRKPPAERRDEILAAASHLAVTEGLERLTLRRVAESLGIVPGLVNHYFPVAEDLAAAAFAYAATAEREAIFATFPKSATPVEKLKSLLTHLLAESADPTSLLWLDAWQATRNRPILRAEVAAQMLAWQDHLITILHPAFNLKDPRRTATRIMALIDGFSIQAAMRSKIAYDAVRDLLFETIERELSLPPATLHP